MTPSELKYKVEEAGHAPYFFTRDSMRFFGDTMRNYGVRAVLLEDVDGHLVDAWEIFRRRPVKNGLKSSAYFHAGSFRRMFPKEEARP